MRFLLLIFFTMCSLPLRAGSGLISVVVMIHEDSSYLYYDKEGNPQQADRDALSASAAFAKNCHNCEVFILRQKKASTSWCCFPRKNLTAYYFLRGTLIKKQRFYRGEDTSDLSQLAIFYRDNSQRFVTPPRVEEGVNLFLYFGHHIPEPPGQSYSLSIPAQHLSVAQMQYDLQKFKPEGAEEKAFDAMVLATCNGATPYTIHTFAEIADYIVASPEKLHLSGLDLSVFFRLDSLSAKNQVPDFLRELARTSFAKLQRSVKTAISIGLYDARWLRPQLARVLPLYFSLFQAPRNPLLWAFKECSEAGELAELLPRGGVQLYFQDRQFKLPGAVRSPSGWCCPEPVPF